MSILTQAANIATSELQEITKVALIMADGTIEEVVRTDATANEDLQGRVDNLYTSEFENDAIDTLIGYNVDGDETSRLTAAEFFGERMAL